MIQQPQFKETPQIKQEISNLEKELEVKKRELAGESKAEIHDKDLIKEIIKEKAVILPSAQKAPTTPLPVEETGTDEEKKEKQIKLLTELAVERGVAHAIEVADKLDDPYILDEFHDILVDKLYKHLLEQGKLKQV